MSAELMLAILSLEVRVEKVARASGLVASVTWLGIVKVPLHPGHMLGPPPMPQGSPALCVFSQDGETGDNSSCTRLLSPVLSDLTVIANR